jgi:hypothetical protein
MDNALKAKRADIREQYESQLRALQEASASAEIPDTEIRCKDDLGGVGWGLEGCSFGTSSSKQ